MQLFRAAIFHTPRQSAASRHRRSPRARVLSGWRSAGRARAHRRLWRLLGHSRRESRRRRSSTGGAGLFCRASSTRTCTSRRRASSAQWVERCSTGWRRSRCRKRRGWPTVRYAVETAALFVRALASHGTTTALVFGAHFADATAELFEAAAASGLRIASGLVLSDRLLRPDLHATPEQAYRDSTMLIKRYHKRGRLLYAVTPRFAYSTTESMLEVCQQLMREHPDVRLQTHINESPAEIGALSASLSVGVRLPGDLRAIRVERSALGDGAQRSRHRVGDRTGSRTQARLSRTVPAATPRSAAVAFRCGVTSMRGSRARSARMWAAARVRHAEGSASRVSDAAAGARSAHARCRAIVVSVDARRCRSARARKTTMGDFQTGQGGGFRVSAAAGRQRSRCRRATRRTIPGRRSRRCLRWRARRACAKCVLKGTSCSTAAIHQ